ncbi:MAG: cell division protein SepF [Actinomycetaceae bacterium]|nr:cell division protein SepF [Actinomycetaceae bacterium]MDY6083041.1 cell division protein SepF [Actinomycetaceae bacterium]
MFRNFVNRAAVGDEDYQEDDYVNEVPYEDEEASYEDGDASVMHAVGAEQDLARIITSWPKTVDEASSFAKDFRNDIPVILNLSESQTESRQRIIDFASGVCYGLRGHLNQISENVFLMTPATVTLDAPASTRTL